MIPSASLRRHEEQGSFTPPRCVLLWNTGSLYSKKLAGTGGKYWSYANFLLSLSYVVSTIITTVVIIIIVVIWMRRSEFHFCTLVNVAFLPRYLQN